MTRVWQLFAALLLSCDAGFSSLTEASQDLRFTDSPVSYSGGAGLEQSVPPASVAPSANGSSSSERSRRGSSWFLTLSGGSPPSGSVGFAVSGRKLLSGALILVALSWLYSSQHIDPALRGVAARQQASDLKSGFMMGLQRNPGVVLPGLLLDFLSLSMAIFGVCLWGFEVLRPRKSGASPMASVESASDLQSETLLALRRQLLSQASLSATSSSAASASVPSASAPQRFSSEDNSRGRISSETTLLPLTYSDSPKPSVLTGDS